MSNGILGRVLSGAVGVMGLLALPASLSAQTTAAPTFTKDVAPIFQAKCESCHRPDSIAPMSLVTYEEARPWARSIRDRVATRQMPPWHIDKTVGIQHFKNDRSLSDAGDRHHRRSGSPPARRRATPKDMPRAGRVGRRRRLELRQQVRRPARPDHQVAGLHAEGRRAWTRGTSRSSTTGLTEPRWVRAIEMRPGTVKGRKITHHALARLQQDDEANAGALEQRPTATSPAPACSWSGRSASRARSCAPNSGKLMLPGSKIRLGHPLPRRRRRHHRHGRTRHLLLPEGPGAEVPPGAGALQRHHRRQPRPRHRAQLDQRRRRTST